jgi:four helix bundle protein
VKIERFEDIEAWQPVESLQVERLARELARKVYGLTKKTKFARNFGLKGQIQDAAGLPRSMRSLFNWGSSMHNIVEGFDSETNPEFVRFLRYAKRSCTEVQTCPPSLSLRRGGRGELYVALDQQYITNTEFQDVYDHAGRTFTLLGNSDRARCHSWFHQVLDSLQTSPKKRNPER